MVNFHRPAGPPPVTKRDDANIVVMTFTGQHSRSWSDRGWGTWFKVPSGAGEKEGIWVSEGSDADRRIKNELLQGHRVLKIQIVKENGRESYLCLGKG